MAKDVFDYRMSHTAPRKGASYDKTFSSLPYRRDTWEWEKHTLIDAISTYYKNEPKNIDYLDFACGTGRIIGFLESHVSNACGVDVSDSMLEVAKENVQTADIIKADLTCNNELAGKSFDLITAFRFFSNAQPELRREVLTVLSSLLSERGCLILNIHRNKNSLSTRLSYWYNVVRHGNRNIVGISLEETKTLIDDADLKIVKLYSWGLLPIVKDSTKVPTILYKTINDLASRIPSLSRYSQNLICVCERKGGK